MDSDDVFSYVMDRLQCREQCVEGATCEHRQPNPTMTLSRIFKWWLWVPDANEQVMRYIFTLNTVQLTGIFLSRELAIAACHDNSLVVGCMKTYSSLSARDLLCSLNAATETESTVFIPHETVLYTDLTLRQYRDVMESIQWQWCSLLQNKKKEAVSVLSKHLDALFCLFGYFISVEESEHVFDDNEFVEFAHKQENGLILHATAVKMYIHLFYILYRSLFLARIHTRIEIQDVESEFNLIEIQHFHVEASLDEFYNLSMFFDLAPSCYIDYKHAFSGFFNNVSQAVFRHYPSYKRKNQETLENINQVVKLAGFDVNVLPCLKQLYPEINNAWEDHYFGRELHAGKQSSNGHTATFLWLCIAGDFYLVNDVGDVFAADNVVILTAFYVKYLVIQKSSLHSGSEIHI
jgi:hypothetical protein